MHGSGEKAQSSSTCPQPDRRSPCDCKTHVSLTLLYLSGLSKSICRVLYIPTLHPGHLPSLQDPATGASTPKGPSARDPKERSCVQHPVCRMPLRLHGQTGRSLDQQRLWDYHRAVKNGDLAASTLAEHVFSCNRQVDLTMVIDTLPYTDSQHARVLAYPTLTGNHTQRRQGHSAWTLCCTAGLTLPLLDYYYYYLSIH